MATTLRANDAAVLTDLGSAIVRFDQSGEARQAAVAGGAGLSFGGGQGHSQRQHKNADEADLPEYIPHRLQHPGQAIIANARCLAQRTQRFGTGQQTGQRPL
jgi:hypothetical protein